MVQAPTPTYPYQDRQEQTKCENCLLVLSDYPFNFVLFYTGPLSNFSMLRLCFSLTSGGGVADS